MDGRPNRIRELRVRARLTQEELAERVGLSPSTVSRHENGSRNISPKDGASYRKVLGDQCLKPLSNT